MYYQELSQTQYKEFAKDLYEKSFPKDERRDFSLVEELEKKEDMFLFKVVLDEGMPIGLISTWEFDEFLYVEHFAIDPAIRSKGYGSLILQEEIKNCTKPIVLEVEPPIEEDAIRRVKFYNKLGFSLDDRVYIQPPYSKNQNSLELRLMYSNVKILDVISFEQITKSLHFRVYNVAFSRY